jgi:plastocyanin
MTNKCGLIFMTILLVLSIGLSCCTDNPANATVKITNFSFQPSSITIVAGTTVVWTNEDSAPHTITSDDGSFESGRMSRGSEFNHTFTQPGTYMYHCAIHPSMIGEIKVSEAKS